MKHGFLEISEFVFRSQCHNCGGEMEDKFAFSNLSELKVLTYTLLSVLSFVSGCTALCLANVY